MTVQEIREAAKVMEAYANGKKIQYLNDDNEWIDAPNPLFDWGNCVYRIKPESQYRPFKTQEECWNEMLKHQPFGWLKEKANKKEIAHIGRIFDVPNDTLITLSMDEGRNLSSSYFFRTYTFVDGTPFGIKEEWYGGKAQ